LTLAVRGRIHPFVTHAFGMDALVAAAVLALGFAAPATRAAFGIQDFTAEVRKADNTTLETQAGAHPFVGVTSFHVQLDGVRTAT
jgi:hypothetical protein